MQRIIVYNHKGINGIPSYIHLLVFLIIVMLTGPRLATAAKQEVGVSAATPGSEHAEHEHHHMHAMATTGYQRSLASYSIPDITLLDQHGHKVSLPELLKSGDEPVMLNFIFTSCTAICPMMTAIFAKVQAQLGSDAGRVRMVSVSIDPEHDTPAALSKYAAGFGAGPQWAFLTGSLDDSIAVQKAFDAYRGDKMNHTPLTLFHAPSSAQWVRYDGFADAADLTEEYRSMLAN